MATPRITALAGGVGAARMLRGIASVVGQEAITAVINTGDDMVLHGLHVSPDIDTVTYTLAGASNEGTGWGLADESWTVMGALQAFEAADRTAGTNLTWFNLGDRDLATHLFRTGRLAAGATLSEVTAEVAHRFGVKATLLPMTDSRVETRVTVAVELGQLQRNFGGLGPDQTQANTQAGLSSQREDISQGSDRANEPGGHGAHGDDGATARRHPGPGLVEIGFQEYFVGLRHSVEVKGIRFAGAELAQPGPRVVQAISAADVVVICPSNPIVSIAPVLAMAGISEAVARRRDDVVAVSPIVAGRALKGPADRMLAELGHEVSALGVARLWAPIAGTLVVDEADADLADGIEAQGMRCIVAPSVMSGPEEAAALARVVLGARAPC